MNRSLAILTLAVASLVTSGIALADEGVAQVPYFLRDTTGLPPPAAGMARLVVARERFMGQGLKPEFVNVDRTPIGQLPQRTAISTEIPAGWHRVWLGRGAKAGFWMEFVPDGRYLVRLREEGSDVADWRADLVRDARDGYIDFAQMKEMKLCVTTPAGLGAVERDMNKRLKSAKQDSLDRQKAKARAMPPIKVEEAWYLDLLNEDEDYEQHPGSLTLDATTLKFTRSDLPGVEIPRSAITSVRYGGHRRNMPNAWFKIGYLVDGAEKAVAFADTDRSTATDSYNRIFAELEKGLATK